VGTLPDAVRLAWEADEPGRDATGLEGAEVHGPLCRLTWASASSWKIRSAASRCNLVDRQVPLVVFIVHASSHS
jgi:hypothetical protein